MTLIRHRSKIFEYKRLLVKFSVSDIEFSRQAYTIFTKLINQKIQYLSVTIMFPLQKSKLPYGNH